MATKQTVSICLEDLSAAVKANHPAITLSTKNNKRYAKLDIWENDEPDKFGNNFSVALYDKEANKSTYIGNGKKYNPNNAQQNTQSDNGSDDLGF